MKLNKSNYYDKRLVVKPWGHEYVIFRDKNILSVTLLHINPKKSTSLHCHPTKKTGFVLLDGKALIQLGLWKSERKVYSSPSKLMIRTGLFHSISNKYDLKFSVELTLPCSFCFIDSLWQN